MINVNTVYQTVLLILNKEQRGYMTPDEFNKMGEQVQLEIFEKYFEDLNQLIRSPQTDSDYADRVTYLEQKISEFETVNAAQFVSGGTLTLPNNLHRINTVAYNGIELQSLGRKEFYNIVKSPLTAPTETYPVYTQDNGFLRILPTTIAGGVIELAFLRTPIAPIWGFEVNSNLGIYVYKSTSSANFELHISEQTEVILRILAYAGIIIRDPQIVQAASAQVQQQNINEKR
jgi:hypothetical protein|tara:strand:+ start:640 stop:1332 length:693 start_codon:yes stop_codon:yes gene_type:complete